VRRRSWNGPMSRPAQGTLRSRRPRRYLMLAGVGFEAETAKHSERLWGGPVEAIEASDRDFRRWTKEKSGLSAAPSKLECESSNPAS
jgi:hypothetical protein